MRFRPHDESDLVLGQALRHQRFGPAQSLESNLGKVVRVNRDGTIPKDNPFAGKPGAR
jgi:glucose/arabinose dehydrogenase